VVWKGGWTDHPPVLVNGLEEEDLMAAKKAKKAAKKKK
jgi:hypothetical protein